MTTLKHLALREKVIETCLAMNEEGINQGTSGNVSVRTPEGFLITASGIPYRKMRPEQVVEMDLDGGYRGEFLPSTEWRMHLDIYAERPEAGAIVHVHSPFATALACLRREVPAFHYMIGVTGGTSLRVADYAEFGTNELSVFMSGRSRNAPPASLPTTARSVSEGISMARCGWRGRSRRCAKSIGRRRSPVSR